MADSGSIVLNEHHVLLYRLFGPEEIDVMVISDRIVTAAQPHECVVCLDGIPVGVRVRARVERDNEACLVRTFYACPLCCAAMACAFNEANCDDGRAIEARCAPGIERGRRRFTARGRS